MINNVSKIALLVLIAVACGCKMNFGSKTDVGTGLNVKSNGLSYADHSVTIDGVKITTNEIDFGKKVVLQYNGVKGFTEQNGKVFPGAFLLVTDMSGKKTLEYQDLFDAYTATGAAPELAQTITITLTTGNPMEKSKEYNWKVRVWDKKGKGEIVSEMKVKMK